ncbi:MAG TPA: MFS transporter [bacterium]|nr:MFS transporter [bacterium]
MILVAAVIMQMCLGATYAWNVFVAPLKEISGLDQGPVQLPLSIFYVAFPLTVLFSPWLVRNLGPRRCAIIGGVLFGGGWLTASLGQSHFGIVVVSIGVLAGIGVGFAYLVPISTCILWFPNNKGLVTGIAVAGFGGGAALVSRISGYLIQDLAFDPFHTFRVLGTCFILAIGVAGMFMRLPPGCTANRQRPFPLSDFLNARPFQILYFGMFAGLVAGLGINGNLKQMCRVEHFASSASVAPVALFAIANAAGRITWGALFDRTSPSLILRLNLLSQATVLLLAHWILGNASGLTVFALLTGFNYGGVLVLYASSVAHIWGPQRVGQVYSWVFSANIFASQAPFVMGLGYDAMGSFTVPLLVVSALLLTAFVLASQIRNTLTKVSQHQ